MAAAKPRCRTHPARAAYQHATTCRACSKVAKWLSNKRRSYKRQTKAEKKQAKEEARLKAEEEARLKAEEEVRLKAEEDTRRKAEEEERLKAEEEARLKAESEARLKAEEDARRKAEEEARLKAQEAAKLKADEEESLDGPKGVEALLSAQQPALTDANKEDDWLSRLLSDDVPLVKWGQACNKAPPSPKSPASRQSASYSPPSTSIGGASLPMGEEPALPRICLTILCLVTQAGIAIKVPKMAAIIGLLGGTVSTILMMVVPAYIIGKALPYSFKNRCQQAMLLAFACFTICAVPVSMLQMMGLID